jgi:polyhydroxybutyrate depolymerase
VKMIRKSLPLIACIMIAVLLSVCLQASPLTTAPSGSIPVLTGTASVTPGDYEETIAAGGKMRNYLLHVPPSYNAREKMPLVIILHGGGGSAKSMAEVTGMNAKADEAGFIAVYPGGTGPLSDERILTWNAGTCCGYALENNVDDVGFIRQLIAELEKNLAVDASRIYAAGISNGGMMSYRLACELADKIAAIAPVAGAMGMAGCVPANPVSVIIFHGTADEHVLYEGGAPLKIIDTHPRIDKPVSYAVDFWVDVNGCSREVKKETSGNIIKETYSGGKNGTAVVLYTIVGGKHAWPGGKAGWLGGDTPIQEISATNLMWDFFASHHKE